MSEGKHVAKNFEDDLPMSSVADHAKRFMDARVSIREVEKNVSDDWKFHMLANHPNHPHRYIHTLPKEGLWERGMDQLLMPAYHYAEAHESEPDWRTTFFAESEEIYGRPLAPYEEGVIADYFGYRELAVTQPNRVIADDLDPRLERMRGILGDIDADFENGGAVSAETDQKIASMKPDEREERFLREYIQSKS